MISSSHSSAGIKALEWIYMPGHRPLRVLMQTQPGGGTYNFRNRGSENTILNTVMSGLGEVAVKVNDIAYWTNYRQDCNQTPGMIIKIAFKFVHNNNLCLLCCNQVSSNTSYILVLIE